jgi:prepilin-type N-terminal cleavage/methylation domain-containing protein
VRTERAPRRRRPEGFTLIEVLIALVILAIGLLALAALGIGASRMSTRASYMSAYTGRATSELESMIGQIRASELNTPISASSNINSAGGVTRARVVTTATPSGSQWTVTVKVYPQSGHPVLTTRDSLSMSLNVYRP